MKKGYIPESFDGLENEIFSFVHLDMNLYAPTLAGLRFFAPRMIDGGVILIHDYYYPHCPGIKRSLDEFNEEFRFQLLPIGDDMSIALVAKKGSDV